MADTGTPKSLLQASNLLKLEDNQVLKLGVLKR